MEGCTAEVERTLIRELAKRSTDEDSVIGGRGGTNGCWLRLDVGKITGQSPVEGFVQFCSSLSAGV